MLLDGALANWLSALIVAVVFAAIAGALGRKAGKNQHQARRPRPSLNRPSRP